MKARDTLSGLLLSRARVAGRAANEHLLRRFGVQLQRVATPTESVSRFYTPPSSCQIPDLGFLFELTFGQRRRGTFVEVGAFDGDTFSNTSCLADLGWTGVLVEPVAEFAAMCRTRHRNNDVQVFECAASSTNGSSTMHKAGGLSTMNDALFEQYGQTAWSAGLAARSSAIVVVQRRLDEILESSGIEPEFDLLVVDVEGHESDVFAGFDLARWRPQAMILELADTHPDLTATRESDADLGRFVVSNGYRVVYKDSINTMFVRDAPLSDDPPP